MKINWTVRLKNKAFWLALIPALLLVIQTVAALLGFTLDLGVVVDPTTEGVSDSQRAMCYTEPPANCTKSEG